MKSFIKRILNFFFLIHKNDPGVLRKKKVLNIFLFATEFIDVWVILIHLVFLIAGIPLGGLAETFQILSISILAALGGILCFIINNFLSNVIANILCLFLITLFVYLADNPYELVLGRSLLLFVLPIIMAGFLIKPYMSYITTFIIIILNLIICFINGFNPSFISLTIYVLIAFMTWFSAINFEKSLAKYREAYKHERFYKDLFVHDVNNILQCILMSIELHEYNLETSIDSINNKDLNLAKIQINRGVNLVKNVRNLNLSSNSEIILKRMEIIKFLDTAIENVRLMTKSRELNIHIDIPREDLIIYADKYLLNIFENILINSVVHNNNSIVEIFIKTSHFHKEGRQFLKVEFIDNGFGIPDSRKKKIFIRDVDKDTCQSGLGIGLSLVKKILNRYKANIWVENRIPDDYEKGSNFILIFPEVIQI